MEEIGLHGCSIMSSAERRRSGHYEEPTHVGSNSISLPFKAVDVIAREICGMTVPELNPTATVKAETHCEYDVYVKRGSIYDVVHKIRDLGPVQHVLLVTDDNVDKLYAGQLALRVERAGFQVLKFVFEPRRKKKALDTAREIFKLLFRAGADRNTVVLNVGGGTVGDLGGFVAALYLRGVRYIHVPTTLMAQADSGVGGKVNVNFGSHLNSLSVFHQPLAVWIDPDVLRTLPDREYFSGLAEIVKYATILDPELFISLENHRDRLAIPGNELIDAVVRRCIERKCQIVSADPKEEGPFRFFNFGHECGHALEVAYDYEHLLHGEAVSIGIVASTWMAVEAGLCDPELLSRLRNLALGLRLPIEIPESLRRKYTPRGLEQRVSRMLLKDKKRTPDGLVWIVPRRLGDGMCTTNICGDLVERCLRGLAKGKMNVGYGEER